MQTLTDRMGEDMRLRGFAPKTQQAYRGAVLGLATHFTRSPDKLDTLTEAEPIFGANALRHCPRWASNWLS